MRDGLDEFKQSLLQREVDRLGRHDYVAYHHRRYAYVLDLCKREVPDRAAAVLDIGPSPLSRALAAYYDDVTTLGFQMDWSKESGDRTPRRHIECDLNDVIHGSRALARRSTTSSSLPR